MTSEINLTPTGTPFDLGHYDELDRVRYMPTLIGSTWGHQFDARAAVLLVHGLGAHHAWFEALARRLKVRQIFSLAYDQAGFGRRQNEPFFSYKQWILDLEAAYNHLSSLIGDKPIYLLGNSGGAISALQAANKIKPAGLILCSPGFAGHPKTFTLSFKLLSILQAMLAPDIEIDFPYNMNQVVEDKEIREQLETDPYHRFHVPARMFLELLKATTEINKRVKKIDCPLLMFTAGKERIVDNKVAQKIFKRIEAPKKAFHQFDESFHDLMFSPDIDDLAQLLVDWINSTIPEKLCSVP